VKPIVYYVSREVPSKWKPWIKKAVEDWNVAFREAGFSNRHPVQVCADGKGRPDLGSRRCPLLGHPMGTLPNRKRDGPPRGRPPKRRNDFRPHHHLAQRAQLGAAVVFLTGGWVRHTSSPASASRFADGATDRVSRSSRSRPYLGLEHNFQIKYGLDDPPTPHSWVCHQSWRC